MTSRTQVGRALRATLHTNLCHPTRVFTGVTAKLTNYCVGSNPAALYSSISRVPCVAKARTAFSTSATVLSVTRDNPDDLFASPRGGSNDDVTDTSDQEAEVDNHDRSTEWLPKRPPTTKPKGDDDASIGESPGSRLSDGGDWYSRIKMADLMSDTQHDINIGSPFHLSASTADDNTALELDGPCRFWTLDEIAESELVPEGIPKSLDEEFAASGTRRMMVRDSDAKLWDKIQRRSSILLDGEQGAGKTVACVRLVATARKAGWHVLYVPSAQKLTIESSYQRNESTGMWDTPEHARIFLKWTEAALAVANERDGADVDAVREGLDSIDREPKIAVNAALRVIENAKSRAKSGGKVLFVVDEYNALFGPTDMHEVLGPRKRGNIKAGETRLCAALRDASDIVRSGAVYLGATSTAVQLGYRLSESLGHECGADGSQVLEREQCRRLSTKEILGMVQHYERAKSGLGAVHPSVDRHQLSMRLRVLTQGNGKEIRELCAML